METQEVGVEDPGRCRTSPSAVGHGADPRDEGGDHEGRLTREDPADGCGSEGIAMARRNSFYGEQKLLCHVFRILARSEESLAAGGSLSL